MSNELSLKEKVSILLKNGLIRREDRNNVKRVENRWHIYQTVHQKTAKITRPKSDR